MVNASTSKSESAGIINFPLYHIFHFEKLTFLQADTWKPAWLYREIMDIDFPHSSKLSLNSKVKSPTHTALHPHLAYIMEDTLNIRNNTKYIHELSRDQLKVPFNWL
jgi:hypothetical protein